MDKVLILLLCAVILAGLPVLSLSEQSNKSTTIIETLPFDGLGNGEGEERPGLLFKLYLPAGYVENPEARYPVLYLLHGSNGSFKDSEWDAFFSLLDRLIAERTIPPLVAVAPVAGNSYWVDSAKFGPYESAFINALIPHVDANFRTLGQREQRYLAGFSMGGYGALRYSLAYPELFSGCILLSPFVQREEPPATSRAVTGGVFAGADGEFDPKRWDEKNYPGLLAAYASQEERARFFIYAGDDDWNHLSEKEDLPPDAWKYNMEVQAVLLYSALNRENPFQTDFPKWESVPGNPAQLRIVDGGHDGAVWLQGFEEGLLYLLK